MTKTNQQLVSTALFQIASAIHYDWSQINGRTVSVWLDELGEANLTSDPFDYADWKRGANLCPASHGHWTSHCDEFCDTPKGEATR